MLFIETSWEFYLKNFYLIEKFLVEITWEIPESSSKNNKPIRF